MNLMMELRGKLKERKTQVIEKEPVSFKVFDQNKDNFIETTEDDRLQKEAEHNAKIAEIKRKEEEEKRNMERLVKEQR